MHTSRLAVAVLALSLASGGGSAGRTASPRTPVLVELFTSEGCSSCPPADELLARLVSTQPVADAEIVALELHVDYWDRQGWKDPFSSAAFTKRQEDYSRVLKIDSVYTPQMIVDGAAEVAGSEEARAIETIRRAAGEPHLPLGVNAAWRGSGLRVSVEAPAAPAQSETIDIVVAVIENGLTSSVTRGENRGRSLTHSGVVRGLQVIGAIDRGAFVAEGEMRVNSGWTRPRVRVVAFLQGRKSRHVYATASSAVP